LARRADAAAIAGLYAPNVTNTAISFELDAPAAEDMEQRLARVQASAPWLVCEADGVVCGYAYASRHHERAAYQWSVDAAVYVAAGHHRGGVGRALYTTLLELLRLQHYYCVHAGITLPNAASVGLHESLGFRRIGVYPAVGYKRGAWHDVGWWQLELLERRGEPLPLLSPERAARERADEWRAAFEIGERLLR
jgi:phosphinothricin acetyltransferase